MTTINELRPRTSAITFRELVRDLDVHQWVNEDKATCAVTGVTVSSSDIDAGWVFVAIPGYSHHGAEFAAGALEAGAAGVITDEKGARILRDSGASVPIAVVDDPRQAAAFASARVVGNPDQSLTTAAVTGTNGKTTTTYLVSAALGAIHDVPALCGTVETRIGDMTILATRTTNEAPVLHRFLACAQQQGADNAVIEVSSHALSLNRVDGIVFDVAIFTNLQHDHLDFYHDMEHYFQAKASLFTPEHALRGIVCVDDEWGQRLAREATILITTVAALSSQQADWHVSDIHPDPQTAQTVFSLTDPAGHTHQVHSPVLGEVNVQNCAVAIAAATAVGADPDQAVTALERAPQVPGRMEKVNPDCDDQPLVIVDYAHTPEAMEWILKDARELAGGRVVLVFGTDGDRDASKRIPLAEVAARHADVLWVTDENPRTEDAAAIRAELMEGIRNVRPDLTNVTEVTTCRRDAVRCAIQDASANDIVLITGKGAEWYQEIDHVYHRYNDVPVAREVLEYSEPRKRG
ncbi:UDP-N-acetylmuramoyl-L-alanyl-D-glutamate--2,6-diaminopimelate ligase [Pauljensenia sp. UMB10120]|uniref:UDP-N-acetylmuramoyl-L-alanyl-D-glutamate--2, 6-diaminopimelate ligase n=1 Tax=Pauljensenia sp. UMB10120 TaxID=3046356 RepID=UPI00254C8258|nr:UDP-N-acetylmuramoyl-L-alanyl-D-glutamate--2,6-diaminopimelate ligase [Pauljensenia sp. UMB10120]MDK6242017.1 UDP-N-acetylmuramoyl-L-alanyl-D-glutamate--2,6-diaminopimelate ligase [Pauljensenia sp. UMB10120]